MSSLLAKAPWASSKEDAMGQDGDSLTTVLPTVEDRSSLTILVADCTESMRKTLLDVFDPRQTGKKVDLKVTADSDLADSEAERPSSTTQEAQDLEQDKLVKELAQREKEVAKMQDLKTQALKHFDEWSSQVIQRIGEVVNSRDTAQAQKEEARPQKSNVAASPQRFPELPKVDAVVQEMAQGLYPPVENPLRTLPREKRALILHSLLLLLLSLEHYHSQSRVLLLYVSTSLDLPLNLLGSDESKIARGLLTAAENMQADEETKKAAEQGSTAKKWKVGLATVAGAALIGVTGGLAAPLLAAGIGSALGGLGLGATAAAGYLGTLAGSSIIVGGLFGAYGGRMTGKMMDKYAREVEDFAFVPVHTSHKPRKIEREYRRLRVGIGISGWLTKQPEVVEPWKVIGAELETFALQWELEALLSLGNSMTTMVKSAAWSYAKVEIVKRTVFAALMAGLWPLGLLKISRLLDNPFSIANQRSQKAGEVLADALINKAQGERPVTLVGYGLGAKVIFTCLQRLAAEKAFGLVESAVLIGTPASSTDSDWRTIRSVVAGRVVNVYSVNDFILAFLYRSYSIQYGVAGLQPIENVKGVENVDVSDIVSGHTSYRFLTGTILKKIGFEDIDDEEVKKEIQALEKQKADDEAERKASEEKQDGLEEQSPARDGKTMSDEQVQKLETEINEKTKNSYIGWTQDKMVAAGSSVGVAYQKATSQWSQHNEGSGDKTLTSVTNTVKKTAAGEDTAEDEVPPALPTRPKAD